MARVRDYRAEYQARKALEQERARAEGRPYESGRARGHKDTASERLNSQLRYWTKRSRYGLDPGEYAQDVQSAIARLQVLDILKAKVGATRAFQFRVDEGEDYDDAARHTQGRDRWSTRLGFIPWSLYFYHGGETG